MYWSRVILVVNCAWFTLFLSTYDSGTWKSNSSWNLNFFTNPIFFGYQQCVIHYFFVNIWFKELKNARILVHEKKISNITSILPVLELVVWVSHHHQFYVLFKISAKVTCSCNCSLSFVSLYFSSSFPYWVFQFLLIFAPSLFLFPFFSFFCCSFFLRFFLFFSFYFFLICQTSQHPMVKAFPLLLLLWQKLTSMLVNVFDIILIGYCYVVRFEIFMNLNS